MDQLIHEFNSTPPVTRYWLATIVLTSVATSLGFCTANQFLFVQEKALGREPWLLVTSFCFFGPMSMSLLLTLWSHRNQNALLEESYQQSLGNFSSLKISKLTPYQRTQLVASFEKYKTFDYFYFIFLISTSIITVATIGFRKKLFSFWLLGPILADVLVCIWSKENPHLEFNIMGIFTVSTSRLPLINVLQNLLMSQEFRDDLAYLILHLADGNLAVVSYSFTKLTHLNYFWNAVTVIGISHFWYVFGLLLPRVVYFDKNTERREIRNDIRGRRSAQRAASSVLKVNVVRSVFKRILLPPWYWFIIDSFPAKSPEELARENDVHNEVDVEVEEIEVVGAEDVVVDEEIVRLNRAQVEQEDGIQGNGDA